jgi:hypothetical protein
MARARQDGPFLPSSIKKLVCKMVSVSEGNFNWNLLKQDGKYTNNYIEVQK